MDYTSAFASHQPVYAHNFGNPSAEQLHQHYHQQQHYTLAQSAIPNQNRSHYPAAVAQHQIACDIKPRLTKEQHDVLEAHYTEQTKPNTSTKKGFAESLNVSLDKVNNWFQNRRAKSKQDAKKAQSAQQALNESQQNTPHINSSGSESEPSPAFASTDYYNMMQQCNTENSMNSDFDGMSRSQFEENTSVPMALPMSSAEPNDQFQTFDFNQSNNDMFESSQNRRTLTQEQFNAMSQQSVLQGSNGFNMDMGAEMFGKMYPGFSQPIDESDEKYDFQSFSGLQTSNQDTSIPPAIAEQSVMGFPSSNAMQARSVTSSASSDWGGSRSSSISTLSRECNTAQPGVPTQSQAATSSQWRPGQSVPVDFNQLSEEFRQIAQARHPQHPYLQEQPLAWPMDEAYNERKNSSTAAITQSLGNVGLKTPQPQQGATFKSPTPSASLATRRQRTKPAPLALRSQSYSAGSQPGSPGQMPQNQPQQHYANPVPAQPLRRIKSSNMINGVAQGRIQKSNPGSSQRSPLNFSFQDAMNSPKGARHLSSHNGHSLVPPTPLSPREYARADATKHMQHWQSSSGQFGRQASISESDTESVPNVPVVSGVSDNFSSPPHTPLYPPQPQFAQQRVGKHIITENTPPQSAPATQQSFASNSFMPPPPHNHSAQQQSAAMPPPQTSQQTLQDMFPSFATATLGPEPQFSIGDMSMSQHPQFTLTASEPMGNPQMHFPLGGMPMVDQSGNFMPQPHYQLVPHPPPMPPASAPPLNQTPPMHYPFPVTTTPSPGLHMNAHVSKPAAPQPELFVHEYRPPADVKRAVTPRKVAADGPKNYTFANQTPEHFEKGRKATAATSHSPASNSS
ncbi:hypothetical protein Q7P37_001430 [Cladosporium fusiforme]